MSESVIAVFIPIILGLGVFTMILGLRYLQNKENMAMIERGIEPVQKKRRTDPTQTLRNGMIFVGAGFGLLLAIIITRSFDMGDSKGLYFALIAIFGGLGLLGAYAYERKNPPENDL
ncbi:MAG: hypothetical protein IPL65_12545 [Lewinellaceae bacterium]|nr:hypothetical protein [Lewinellaceae bacterium]